MNLILNTDSYKTSHWKQYPPNTEGVFSYIEARGGEYNYSVMFGLRYFLTEYLSKGIRLYDIEEADQFCTAHGVPFNREGWMYILNEHEGRLPVVIKAVPEGTVVPIGNVMLTIENTDPECYWLTSYLETALLRAVWYGSTVATVSRKCKEVINNWLVKSGDPTGLPFKLHDFGARGVSSHESAMIGGAAHLVNFMGTDTIEGAQMLMKYYDSDMPGFSIPASEHSTITCWGKDREVEAYANMLTAYKDSPIVACVSDSYDIYNAVENLWGTQLKGEVEDFNGLLVIRPDSGDPVEVNLRLARIIADRFGYTRNDKGYIVFNNVAIIQGDGVDPDLIDKLLGTMVAYGYSADNWAFGMGGALLQRLDRDTQQYAMKCSAMKIEGEWVDVTKSPIDAPEKASKGGRLILTENKDGKMYTRTESDWYPNKMVTVFRDGELHFVTEIFHDLKSIRKRAALEI